MTQNKNRETPKLIFPNLSHHNHKTLIPQPAMIKILKFKKKLSKLRNPVSIGPHFFLSTKLGRGSHGQVFKVQQKRELQENKVMKFGKLTTEIVS